MSFVVVPKDDAEERAESILERVGLKRRRDRRAFLLIELCADGHHDAVLERLATTIPDDLLTSHPGDWKQRRARDGGGTGVLSQVTQHQRWHQIVFRRRWAAVRRNARHDRAPHRGRGTSFNQDSQHSEQRHVRGLCAADSRACAQQDLRACRLQVGLRFRAGAAACGGAASTGHHQVAGVRCVPGFH